MKTDWIVDVEARVIKVIAGGKCNMKDFEKSVKQTAELVDQHQGYTAQLDLSAVKPVQDFQSALLGMLFTPGSVAQVVQPGAWSLTVAHRTAGIWKIWCQSIFPSSDPQVVIHEHPAPAKTKLYTPLL